jgi:hypothetical protein
MQAAEYFHENTNLRREMEGLLSSWDLGLTGIEIREVPVSKTPADNESSEATESKPRYVPFGVHELADGSTHTLPMFEESNGTRAAFNNLSMFFRVFVEVCGRFEAIEHIKSHLLKHFPVAHSR